MPVRLRLARVDEHDAVGALTLDAYVADGGMTRDHPYAPTLTDAARRARDGVLLVADDAGRLLGTATYVPPGSSFSEIAGPAEAEVRALAVHPAARGAGIARRLMDECVDRARQDGCPALVLCTRPSMAGAQRLYVRMGFRRTPEKDWSPRPGLDLVAYRLEL